MTHAVVPSDNWDELRRSLVRAVAIAYGLASWLLWFRLPTSPRQDVVLVLLAAPVAAACLAAAFAPSLPPRVAALLEVAGPFVVIWYSYHDRGYEGALLFLLVPPLLAALTISSRTAPLLALVPCWLVLRSASISRSLAELLALQALTLGVPCLVAAWGLRSSLWRAWADSTNAVALARDVRLRQEEVNRLNKALHVANGLLKRSLRELAAAQREAAEARHLKEQFATTVSHELRTPLNVILGFIEVMQTWPEVYGDVNWTPSLRRDVNEIAQSAHYLSDLVDDILDLARVQALRMPMRRDLTDLPALLEEVTGMAARLLLSNSKVVIRSECSPGLPRVYVDRTRVRQVLLNLLANACRFTSAGEIRVRMEAREQDILTSVADTGPGIPADRLEAVFDEYRQSDSPELEQQHWGGKGLGLAIAKRFVQLHGGRIWAESVPGQGSTFYFTLPLVEKGFTSLGEPPLQQPLADGSLPSVVLLGDEEARTFLARHLEGYAVLLAEDLAAARRLVREQHPELLIVNAPPPPEGATRGSAPAILPEAVPVVQCTLPGGSWYGESDLFDDWLIKPIDRARLLAALDRFPDGRTILLVDDDPSFILLIRRMLETQSRRYDVIWANDGEEGLRQLRESHADIVLLDIALPRMNGHTVARTIRASAPDHAPAVIAVTAVQPGAEAGGSAPGCFAVTAYSGIGEGSALELIRSCLVHLKPDYSPAELVEEPEAGQGALVAS